MSSNAPRSVMLVHDRGWGWALIEQVIEEIPKVTDSFEQVIELVNRHDPDVIIGKPNPKGEVIAPLISESRANHDFRAGSI